MHLHPLCDRITQTTVEQRVLAGALIVRCGTNNGLAAVEEEHHIVV